MGCLCTLEPYQEYRSIAVCCSSFSFPLGLPEALVSTHNTLIRLLLLSRSQLVSRLQAILHACEEVRMIDCGGD